MIRVVNPKVQIEEFDPEYIIRKIERCARVCYKTEGAKSSVGKLLDSRLLKATNKGEFWDAYRSGVINEDMLKGILKSVHSSVLEHCTISMVVTTNRACSHEWVRHRVGVAYSQESSRYCNYSKDKFDNKVAMLKPYFYNDHKLYDIWETGVKRAAAGYFVMLKEGGTTEEARELLPNSTKTDIAVTFNMNAFRHFFNLRASQKAHPEIRRIAAAILKELNEKMPVLFADIYCRHIKGRSDFPGLEDVEIEYIRI